MATAAAQARPATDSGMAGPLTAGLRLTSIDMLRGLVIILMVLDHVRDFFHAQAFTVDPLNPDQTSLALYTTRWITHLCAPSFVFLAGVSAFLKGARDNDAKSLAWFLFSRGLWLVILEWTVVGFGWSFWFIGGFLQVIWAIGLSMMLLSAVVWAGPRVVLALGAVIMLGHNLLGPIDAPDFGQAAPTWNLIHEQGFTNFWGLPVFVAYPVLPWFGIMCLGYGLGGVFLKPDRERVRTLLMLAGGFIGAFLILRCLNLYGDPDGWSARGDFLKTAMSFMDVEKYPPSLHFALITLGISFLLLVLFERVKGPAAELFLTYGRVPLFAYVLHLYLAHALAMLIGTLMGFDPTAFIASIADPSRLKGWGFSLPVVYLVWAFILAVMYPLCQWFGEVKRRRRDWWLSYL